VVDLEAGESITIVGVDAASLGPDNFLVNQAPSLSNSNIMTVSDGAMLPVGGVIQNSGTIALNSTGNETDLEIVSNTTLRGGGQVVLSDNNNVIYGTTADTTLTNIDNTISGSGRLGNGQMVLVNEGTINANGTRPLVIDTGDKPIVNSSTLEGSGPGGLIIASALLNSGELLVEGGNLQVQDAITGGNAIIDGGTLEFDS